MRQWIGAVCVLGGLLASGSAAAGQGIVPIAVEGRAGYAVPQGDWSDGESLENGFGYGIDLRIRILPLVYLYGGWDTHDFAYAGSGDGEDAEATDSGMHLGGEIAVPLSAVTGISPFAFGGIAYNRTSMPIRSDGLSRQAESEAGLGYEVGAGLAIPFAPTLTLRPQVRYRSHPAEFLMGATTQETTISYFSANIGLRLGL